MGDPPKALQEPRKLLAFAVILNLLSTVLALVLRSPQPCHYVYRVGCGQVDPAILFAFWGLVILCGALPVVGIARPSLAPIGTVGLAALLFLLPWALISGLLASVEWTFPLFVVGGFLGLWGSTQMHNEGFPRVALTALLGGATWSGLSVAWLGVLLFVPTFSVSGIGCSSWTGSTYCQSGGFIPDFAVELVAIGLALLAGLALFSVWRGRYCYLGIAGSLGVLLIGFQIPTRYLPLQLFTTCAAFAFAVAAILLFFPTRPRWAPAPPFAETAKGA